MATEFSALMKNGTWDLLPPRPQINLVRYKWIFRIKRKPDRSIDHYKACLVADFHQQLGLDYGETYS